MRLLLVIVVTAMGIHALGHAIASTKISLLKEMKLMRLERLGLPGDDIASAARKSAFAGASTRPALSAGETVRWFAALLLAAMASAIAAFWLWSPGGTLTDESHVTLLADGSGTDVSKTSYPYFGWLPMTSSSIWTGLGPYTITHWIDNQGRDLPMTVATIDGNRKYTVELAEPVMPGEQVRETRIGESPKMAKEADGLWTFQGDPMYGYQKNIYLVTVQLPKGAEIVSVDPKPAEEFVRDGQPTVRFQAIRDFNQKFEHKVEYRLPKDGADSRDKGVIQEPADKSVRPIPEKCILAPDSLRSPACSLSPPALRQIAMSPLSPVRMRMALSRSLMNIFPSPTWPVWAEWMMASSTVWSLSSGTTTSTLILGTKSTLYSAPRYISVWPFWRRIRGPR